MAYVTHVVIRDVTDSLAGGTAYNFGTGASADTWMTNMDLSGMTTASTGYAVLSLGSTNFPTEMAASDAFGIKAGTGATADPVTATIDVFGYLVA